MSELKKWRGVASPDEPAVSVANKTVHARLAAVLDALPRAADRAFENVEHVHGLRVATRRAIAALRLYAEFLPPKRTNKIAKLLKRVRRSAGAARDLDVMQLRLAQELPDATGMQAAVALKRRAAQPAIGATKRAMIDDGKLVRAVERLEVRAGDGDSAGHLAFRAWARRALRPILDRFFEASRELDTVDALHAFRIRGKELRYAMELLAAAFPRRFRKVLYARVRDLQSELGLLQDHASACTWFRQWIDASNDDHEIGVLHCLLDREEQLCDGAVVAFRARWSDAERDRLQAAFAELLDDDVQLASA